MDRIKLLAGCLFCAPATLWEQQSLLRWFIAPATWEPFCWRCRGLNPRTFCKQSTCSHRATTLPWFPWCLYSFFRYSVHRFICWDNIEIWRYRRDAEEKACRISSHQSSLNQAAKVCMHFSMAVKSSCLCGNMQKRKQKHHAAGSMEWLLQCVSESKLGKQLIFKIQV